MDTEPGQTPVKSKRERREQTRLVAMVALTALVTIFAVLNVDRVRVDWIVGSWRAPLIIVIAVTLLVGIVLGALGQRASSKRGH